MVNFTKALHCLALGLALPAFGLGYIIRGSLDESVLPLSSADFSSTTIRLTTSKANPDTQSHETYLQKTGQFVFTNVSLGTYLLTLDSVLLATDSAGLKVTISPNQVQANKVFAAHDWETDVGPLVEYPIVIEPVFRPAYIAEREKFSAIAMLKSPMILLTLGSLVMIFVLPKMVEGLG